MLLYLLEEVAQREAKAVADAAAHPTCSELPLEKYILLCEDGKLAVLISELDRSELTHKHYVWIGERLTEIGDTRPGVGVTPENLPDIVWLPVNAGQVEVDRAGSFHVDPFYIAKYPITYQQFQPFLDDPEGFFVRINGRDWMLMMSIKPNLVNSDL